MVYLYGSKNCDTPSDVRTDETYLRMEPLFIRENKFSKKGIEDKVVDFTRGLIMLSYDKEDFTSRLNDCRGRSLPLTPP